MVLTFCSIFFANFSYKTVAYVLSLINELIAFSSCGMSKARFSIVTNLQLRINIYKRENDKQKDLFMKKCLHYIKLQLLSFGLDVLKCLLANKLYVFYMMILKHLTKIYYQKAGSLKWEIEDFMCRNLQNT